MKNKLYRISKSLSLIVVLCLLLTTLLPVGAYAAHDSGDELLDVVQEAFDDSGLVVDVSEIDEIEASTLWAEVASKAGAAEFLSKINDDGFSFFEDLGTFRVDDGVGSNSAYIISKAYKNGIGDIVCAVIVYNPFTSNIMRIFAAEVDTNNQAHAYYEFEGTFIMTRDSDFNELSFFCGMTSAVVCTIWSAMFMALPVVAPFVGLGCSGAFAFVCSYA